MKSTGAAAVMNTASSAALDGEWTNGASNYPSGNGTVGGDFNFGFNMLPGDVNQGTIVNGQGIAIVTSHWLQTGGLTGDANGDNIVNSQDIAAIASHWLSTLPAGGAGGGAASMAVAPPASEPPSIASPAISASVGTSASSALTSSAGLLGSTPPVFSSAPFVERVAAFIGPLNVTKVAAMIDNVFSEGTDAQSHSLGPWGWSGIASLVKSQAATGSQSTSSAAVEVGTVGEQWSSPIDDDLLATLAADGRP